MEAEGKCTHFQHPGNQERRVRLRKTGACRSVRPGEEGEYQLRPNDRGKGSDDNRGRAGDHDGADDLAAAEATPDPVGPNGQSRRRG